MLNTPEALVREFFKELGEAILPKGNTQADKKNRQKIYRYLASIMEALTGIAEVGSVVIPGIGAIQKAFEKSGKAIGIAAHGLEAQSSLPTLREARKKVSETLEDLKKPVVVVIDDIDRLNTEEVRTLFQLIKDCADFPNVRYLLLYDREQVVHALKDSVCDSEAFLEKILGQVFDLPQATRKQREIVLDTRLKTLGLLDVEGKQMERVQHIVEGVLLPGLPTIRHVKRYVGTVASLLPGVIVEGNRNVDPADFLALEFLRQYVPALYNVLREEDSPVPGGVFSTEFAEEKNKIRESAIPAKEPMKTLANLALKKLVDAAADFQSQKKMTQC